ncbi:MAG: Na+/H+ antiporter subunit E [Chloroflexi bacterium]|nr:Na+/H+ antiporter subunit E [Chloroflexota bacterium]
MRMTVLLTLVMAGVWCLMVGEFSVGQVLLGLLFGASLVLLTGAGRGRTVPWSQLPRRTAFLALYLLALLPASLVLANLDLARRLLRPHPAIRPGIVRLTLGDVAEATAALVAHGITLTPGELVLDASADGRTIYIHVIDASDVELRRTPSWQRYADVLRRVF